VYPDLGTLRHFRGTGPSVMRQTAENQNGQFDHGIEPQPAGIATCASGPICMCIARRRLPEKLANAFGED